MSSLVLAAANSSYAQNEKYRAKLDGKKEVPPVKTTSEGVINFKTKGDMLTWKINVTGISDATGVHIHKGKIGENGEAVVDLLKVSKHSDNPNGMVMRGNVTESSLIGSMAGKTIADLKTAIANGDVRKDKFAQAGVDAFAIARADGCVELLREVGKEVEDGGGVGCNAHLQVRESEGLGSGKATDVGEPITHASVDAGHQFDVSDTVFEADEIGAALAKLLERAVVHDGVVAVVEDDPEVRGFADGFRMGE